MMPTIKEIEKFVRPFYKKRDPMHDFSHILRMKRKAYFLKKQYKNLDMRLLRFLIYFHGLKKWAQAKPKRIEKSPIPTIGQPPRQTR